MFLSLAAVSGLAAVLRLFGLAKHSLWLDEGITLQQVGIGSFRDVLGGLLSADISLQGHSFYIILLFLWRELLGDSDLVLRLFSAVLGFGATPLIYLTARRAFGRRPAAWSAVFSAVSAYGVLHSQEARPYAFAIFTSCLFLWQYISVRSGSLAGVHGLIGVFLTSLLVVTTSVFSFILLYSLVLADILLSQNPRFLGRLWVTALLPSVPVGFYFATVFLDSAGQMPGVLTSTRSASSHLLFVAYALMAGQTLGPPIDVVRGLELGQAVRQYGLQLCALGLASAFLGSRVIVVLLRSGSHAISPEAASLGRFLALAFCFAALAGFAQATVMDFNWLPRHAFYLFPFVALLLPLALVKTCQSSHWSAVLRAMFLLVLLLNLASVWNYYFVPAHERDDYRGVAAHLSQANDADRASVLLIGDLNLLRHYGDLQTLSGRHLVRSSAFEEDLRELVSDTEKVELVLNRGSVFREKYFRLLDVSFEETLRQCCVLEERRRFALFDVYQVTFRDPSATVTAAD